MWFKVDLKLKTWAGLLALSTAAGGCGHFTQPRGRHPLPPPPAPLGTISRDYWKLQEHHGEASDFVIYEHEFQMYSARMNYAGEDHVKQIAARLQCGIDFPVLVERSVHAVRPYDKYDYPVHLDPELDLRRRQVVVHALAAMGIPDAEQRVVIAPALAHPYTAPEASRAYLRGLVGGAANGGGFGGGGGGRFGGFAF